MGLRRPSPGRMVVGPTLLPSTTSQSSFWSSVSLTSSTDSTSVVHFLQVFQYVSWRDWEGGPAGPSHSIPGFGSWEAWPDSGDGLESKRKDTMLVNRHP